MLLCGECQKTNILSALTPDLRSQSDRGSGVFCFGLREGADHMPRFTTPETRVTHSYDLRPSSEAKAVYFHLRVTPGQKQALGSIASRWGCTPAEALRGLIDAAEGQQLVRVLMPESEIQRLANE